MRRTPLRALLLAVLGALALFVAACGSSSNDNSKSGNAGTSAPAKAGKQGGHITVLSAGDVDYIDPGQTYYQFGYMLNQATNRTLYQFKPGDKTTPTADIASGPPEVSADAKTVTVHIKSGIKYAPPVNREITTKDIKYAFERSFTANVPSGYAGAYFSNIVGAPSSPGKYKPISGIQTPDDKTIVFKLSKPVGVAVAAALVMPITSPVPKEYAFKFDQKSPSTYDDHVAFTGPYMVKNDASGKLVGRKAGKRIDLVRNPNWDKSTDYRPAYLDSITFDEGNSDATVSSRRILNGSGLLSGDQGAPPAPVLKQAVQRFKSQVVFIPSGGTRYVALNTKVKPFDNLNVRKAVLAIFDRNAMRLTRGGALVGDIASGWLPPGVPGFEEAGGLNEGTKYDYLKNPSGDPAVAKKYMLAAKAEGVPVTADGKYAGGEKLLTIATNADPGKQGAQVAQAQFEKLGFKLNFRIVPQDTLYTKFCGVPKAKVAICPNVGWFKDFLDPESMLDATFNGKNILQQGNVNWPQLDVPAINAAMAKAAVVAAGTERNKAWAAINDQIIQQAPAIPWIWDKTVEIESKDVQGVANDFLAVWDIDFTSLK
jgi:peptide/nickel transport system substrate-binding protein